MREKKKDSMKVDKEKKKVEQAESERPREEGSEPVEEQDAKQKDDKSPDTEETPDGEKAPVEGPSEDPDAELRLTKTEMMELELHESRAQLQSNIMEKFALREQLQHIEYLAQRDAVRQKQGQAAVSLEAAKRDYNGLIAQIDKRLGINLGDWAIKDDGTLNYIKDIADKQKEKERVPPKGVPVKT